MANNRFLYKTNKVEVKNSPIAGKGLFAIEKIYSGELISVKSGHIVTTSELKELDPTCQDFWVQIRDDIFLSPLTKEEALETALYINHSCDPNVGVDGEIGLVAMRDIEVGEELCYDFAMDTAWPDYSMKCNCGSSKCRHIITGNDWKLSKLQQQYKNYFSWYIQKKIQQLA